MQDLLGEYVGKYKQLTTFSSKHSGSHNPYI